MKDGVNGTTEAAVSGEFVTAYPSFSEKLMDFDYQLEGRLQQICARSFGKLLAMLALPTMSRGDL